MAKRLITDPHLPGVFIIPTDIQATNGGEPRPQCPWRSNHPCHIEDDRGLDPFQKCLICTLNEIRRELELRRLG